MSRILLSFLTLALAMSCPAPAAESLTTAEIIRRVKDSKFNLRLSDTCEKYETIDNVPTKKWFETTLRDGLACVAKMDTKTTRHHMELSLALLTDEKKPFRVDCEIDPKWSGPENSLIAPKRMYGYGTSRASDAKYPTVEVNFPSFRSRERAP